VTGGLWSLLERGGQEAGWQWCGGAWRRSDVSVHVLLSHHGRGARVMERERESRLVTVRVCVALLGGAEARVGRAARKARSTPSGAGAVRACPRLHPM
jgi:hypothetical protein